MYIHEAIKARTVDKPYIVRRTWNEEYQRYELDGVKILPTNTPDTCMIFTKFSRNPCRGWQPQAEDLLADDWDISR